MIHPANVNWSKISALIVLTLLVLRLVSWSIAWVIRRLFRFGSGAAAVASNTLGFAFFVLWLYLDLESGEPVDPAAVLFGGLAFGFFLIFDLLRARWKSKKPEVESTSVPL